MRERCRRGRRPSLTFSHLVHDRRCRPPPFPRFLEVRVITRHNYFYENVTGDCDAFPGTPYSGGFNHEWMNYRGKGRDMLLGRRKFHYDEDGTTVVKLEHVQYGATYLPEDLGPSERAH